MNIILWRHADAEEGSPDNERKLTAKGQHQEVRVADWLNPRLPDTAKILVSPAVRAQQTALALGRDFSTVKQLAPGAEAAAVLKQANWPNEEFVVIVGHQPTLGQVASLLLSDHETDWSIKKGGLWWISMRIRNKTQQTLLRAVITPELL
jgi:phosphohistidine phosphatase